MRLYIEACLEITPRSLPLEISSRAVLDVNSLWIDRHAMPACSNTGDRKTEIMLFQEQVFFSLQQTHKSLPNVTKTNQSETMKGHGIEEEAMEMNAGQGQDEETIGDQSAVQHAKPAQLVLAS